MNLAPIALSIAAVLCYTLVSAHAETNAEPKFLGAPSCSSTSCHGGASDQKNQYLIWSKKDFHSRAYATLTSARSERLAEVLKIRDATQSAKCTVCHAPSATIPERLRTAGLKITTGVSCENCHGASEAWLLSHTRPDFTHEDRVAGGLRDLRHLYVRANTCVACHQTLEPDVAAAGHPELIFELDGQSVAQPKHWRERETYSGAKAWFVGQAVALREMSWQLSQETNAPQALLDRWSGLLWLVQTSASAKAGKQIELNGEQQFSEALKQSDALALEAAEGKWSKQQTEKLLVTLCGTAAQFRSKEIPFPVQARRAERLVLALDRLATDAKVGPEIDAQIDKLFGMAQSLPDFNPTSFADELDTIAGTILP